MVGSDGENDQHSKTLAPLEYYKPRRGLGWLTIWVLVSAVLVAGFGGTRMVGEHWTALQPERWWLQPLCSAGEAVAWIVFLPLSLLHSFRIIKASRRASARDRERKQ